jgi:hypothetical protein
VDSIPAPRSATRVISEHEAAHPSTISGTDGSVQRSKAPPRAPKSLKIAIVVAALLIVVSWATFLVFLIVGLIARLIYG